MPAQILPLNIRGAIEASASNHLFAPLPQLLSDLRLGPARLFAWIRTSR
jgi:hypothetical protein